MDNTVPTAPLACDMATLDAEEREQRQALADRIAAATEEVREEPDGYAFRCRAALLPVVAAFVSLERRCCPFFRFTLTLEPDDGYLWFIIAGRPGVKAFIRAELGLGAREGGA